MQEFKGTPGPWFVTNTSDIFTGLGAKNSEGTEASINDGWQVADCDMGGLCLHEVAINARLIAAAPEMLEALQAFEAAKDLWIPSYADEDHVHEVEALHQLRGKAIAALDKALNTNTTDR